MPSGWLVSQSADIPVTVELLAAAGPIDLAVY